MFTKALTLGASLLFGRSNSDALIRLLGEASLFCTLVGQPETTPCCSLEPLMQVPSLAVAKPAQDKLQRFYGTDGRSISAQQAQ